jgi:RND family efflux transporter MFP subunit
VARPSGAIAVRTARARQPAGAAAVLLAGDLRPGAAMPVGPPATARVEHLAVEVGARVRAGAPLATLSGVGPLPRLQAPITLTASSPGIVVGVHAAEGQTVDPGAPVLTLIPAELTLVVEADDALAARILVGQPVGVAVEGLPRETFAGTVRSVAPGPDALSGRTPILVRLDDPQAKLRPGLWAQASLPLGRPEGTVLVPRAAVHRQSDGSVAVLVVAEGRTRRQTVRSGQVEGDSVEVLRGLAAGAEVVVEPVDGLADGTPVRPS